MKNEVDKCRVCPFECGVDRENQFGVCRLPNRILVSHTQPHFFEEPFISGECGSQVRGGGSGAIFFTGCNGRCTFCQNYQISQPEYWSKADMKEADYEKFLFQCLDLVERQGARNINFVSPTPYSSILADFLLKYRERIPVPLIWNSNGYEKAQTLRQLEGLVDVYLPDLKYFDNSLAMRFSRFPNYFAHATQAILEMHRQVGFPVVGEDGFIQKGLVIRHLVLPGHLEDSKKVLTWIRETFGPKAFVSLMGQYFPTYHSAQFSEIDRKLTQEEYDEMSDYFIGLGFEDGLTQDLASADVAYTPEF